MITKGYEVWTDYRGSENQRMAEVQSLKVAKDKKKYFEKTVHGRYRIFKVSRKVAK